MSRTLALIVSLALGAACGQSDTSPGVPPVDGGGGADAPAGDGATDETDHGPGQPDAAVPPDINVIPPTVDLGPSKVGGVCAVDSDCIDGWCNTAYAGGYCSKACTGDADCPELSECYPDPVGGGGKMCWKWCLSGYDCRLDQFCPKGGGVCTPDCQLGECNPGYMCNTDSGLCVPASTIECEPSDEVCDGEDNDCDHLVDEGCGPTLAIGDTHLVDDLGRVVVGGGGISPTLSFKLSSAAGSFTIVAVTADETAELMLLYTLQSPSGESLIIPTNPYAAPLRTFGGVGVASVLVPNTPTIEPAPGTWKFSVYQEGDVSEVWVYVIQNLRKEPVASDLNVNFWFVGIDGLDAQKAQSDAKFGELVTAFTAILADAGITVGDIRYEDITGTNAAKYAFVDTVDTYDVDEHAELVALSSALPASNDGVNFFFVMGFSGWGLLGKAGGIPGPPLLHGTYESGVVVSAAEFLNDDPEKGIPLTAEAMAHELGHQLGLFHTTEQNGEIHDPLPDTPQCTNDFNGDGLVDAWECMSQGSENLMFWHTTFTTELTADQQFVLHRNPSLH